MDMRVASSLQSSGANPIAQGPLAALFPRGQGSVCAAKRPARWQKWRVSGQLAVPKPSEASLCVQEGGHLRFKTADLGPVLQGLLAKLFGIFSLEDSSENEYAMKTIMRVISFVGPEVSTSSAVLLSGPEVGS